MPQLPPQRLFFYLLFLGILPLAFVFWNYVEKEQELDLLSQQLSSKLASTMVQLQQQAFNRLVYQNYRQSSPHYMDRTLEKMEFLKNETEELKQIAEDHLSFTLKNRLQFLTKGENRLVFIEGSVESFPFYKESVEALAHPVEVDGEDLKAILYELDQLVDHEGDLKAPQLIISDFKLEKKHQVGVNEVFKLDIKLIKREFF